MFTGTPLNSLSSNFDITNYIDGYDVFNSEFITRLDQISTREPYRVVNFGKKDESDTFVHSRPDLISQQLYPSSEDYLSLLLIASRLNPDDIKIGDIIETIPADALPTIVLET